MRKNFAHRTILATNIKMWFKCLCLCGIEWERQTILIRAKRVYRSHKSLWSMFSHWVDKNTDYYNIDGHCCSHALHLLTRSFPFLCLLQIQRLETFGFICVCAHDHLIEPNCLHKTVVPMSDRLSALRVFFSKRSDNRQSIIKRKRRRKPIRHWRYYCRCRCRCGCCYCCWFHCLYF